jgi:hypothetical protein
MKIFKILFICVFVNVLIAKSPNYYIIDPKFSPIISSEDFISFHYGITTLEDNTIKPSTQNKWYNKLARLGELVFIWGPINEVILTTNHEVFGHGYRIRDIGKSKIKVLGYQINIPTPYGKGGGYTSLDYEKTLTSQEYCAAVGGGTEASSVFSDKLILKYMREKNIDGRTFSLYFLTRHDLTFYTMSLDVLDKSKSHDISIYRDYINKTYTYDHLSKRRLINMSFINFLDPFTYYSFIGWLKYIVKKDSYKFPSIKIKNISYLPSFRFGLAPYGPEVFFENFFTNSICPAYAYIRFGNFASNTSFGFGFESKKLYKFNDSISLGAKVDLWHQPVILSKRGHTYDSEEDIYLGYSKASLQKKRCGVLATLIYQQQIKTSAANLYLELGYKTKGFVPGESLSNAVISRFGISAVY